MGLHAQVVPRGRRSSGETFVVCTARVPTKPTQQSHCTISTKRARTTYVNNMIFHVIHAHDACVYARGAMRGTFKFMKMRPGCKRTPYTSDI